MAKRKPGSTQPSGSRRKPSGKPVLAPEARTYEHPEAKTLLRPDVGTQASFRKKKPPQTYRYDSSLSPALAWDGQSATRELGEWLIGLVEEASRLAPPHEFAEPRRSTLGGRGFEVRGLRDAVTQLKALSRPFLDWAGKAERLSFDVPTLPLFVHERLSTKGILETLKGHKRDKQMTLADLFSDPQHSVTDQILKAYEYKDNWTNRMVLGDSLVVMNSLLHYEGLGGQVQMIYMDPPYGVKFGSNFQPFVRKRDVKHNDDEDLTREPEMVKAYRDTWELGLHSYLTYMRDRLLLARDLLTPSGSIFVQISDENLHHVRELMDEVFGAENCCSVIVFSKTSSASGTGLASVYDYLLWYARDASSVRYRQLFLERAGEGWVNYDYVRLPDGIHRRMSAEERQDWAALPKGARVYRRDNLTSQRPAQEGDVRSFAFQGKVYLPGKGTFKTDQNGLERLVKADRLEAYGTTLAYRRFALDFPFLPLNNQWSDTLTGGFVEDRLYVVQTNTKVIERSILMTTDPGDLVLDPTCGSGTTAYVAERWGRRWLTIDTSRVPLALARQRLLTATFPYYQLQDEKRGPAGGFVYARKQNNKGEEIGGIVPHLTLKSIANDEPPGEEVLVDRPEVEPKIIRVTGPFCVEATIPTPVDWEGDGVEDSGAGESYGSFVERMIEVLRQSPVLHVGGGRTVTLSRIRPPAKSLSLSAEAMVDGSDLKAAPQLSGITKEADEKSRQPLPFSQRAVAIVFGPENGAISEKLVYEAAREAHAKSYSHLYVIGFAIQPVARTLVDNCEAVAGIPATYVQATPDLMMGELLKNMRSSQIFSVCGLPEVRLRRVKPGKKDAPEGFSAELVGLDVFDPVTMETEHRDGDDVPAWFLDTDHNNLCFHVCQAFFPRTAAWDDLKRSLKGEFEDSVWDHLAGTKSEPFEGGEHGQIAVKVIDDRGNELLVVKKLDEAE
jgi:adenine-specific DNA-methyltransferase